MSRDGTCVRDYLHIMDLANGHIVALDAMDKPNGIFSHCTSTDGRYRAFNLGRGKGMSVLEMVAAMARATGYKYEYEMAGRRRVRPFTSGRC
jgi:UDP-glucose 4-epimerase